MNGWMDGSNVSSLRSFFASSLPAFAALENSPRLGKMPKEDCGKVKEADLEAGRTREEGIGDELEVKAVCVNHTCLGHG